CTYHWEEIEGFPRVVEHTTSDGEDYRFHYDFAGGQTVVTGRPEQKWQWWFDEETYVTALGRLLRSDTQHSTRTFSYNRLDQITEV
ncbi:hypothetical protein PSZ78_24055, partial [Shigella sonnei]|nr:hypothetical protein [Shigella sonnei]